MDTVSLTRGWTLHEMMISLAITGGVFVLVSSAALTHLRWVRGAGEVAALRTQLGHATATTANVLGQVVSPDDILSAQDTAAEMLVTYGSAFACRPDTGRVVLPSPTENADDALAAFGDTPRAGDEIRILVADDTSAFWIAAHLTSDASVGPACPLFAGVTSTWTAALVEPFTVTAGAALRFARRTRISSYRASDGRWYVGLREWNGVTGTFNAIQPVAGPLAPARSDSATTGFMLSWSDSAGVRLAVPAPADRIVSVTITARGETVRPARVAGLRSPAAPRYADSLSSVVTFRNRP